jgi:hypothetical protein
MSTKICKTCNIEKPIDRYPKWKRGDRPGQYGWKNTCYDCAAAYARNRKADNNAATRKHAHTKRKKINELKTPCIVCGFEHPEAIDFHHLDPSEKEFNVSGAMGKAWDKVKAEIDKCVCLCANCHRLHHAGIIHLEDHLPKVNHR